jgi:putative chitinase
MSPIEAQRLQARLGVAVDGQLGPITYAALFTRMAGKAIPHAAAFGRGAAKHFPAYEITTPLRLAHFMAQTHVESMGYTRLVESLNYSAKRLTQVWPGRFPSLAAAAPFANNPEALANKTYGGRMGNTQPGDGWRYIGRSIKQITGRENYAKCAVRTGLDLLNHPELAADPEHSVHIACDYWGSRCINPLADADDIVAVTKAINGGLNGLPDRKAQLARAKALIL